MTDATPLADITFATDYNTYTDAGDFPIALECTGYIDNDLTNHTYKNPTTSYDNIQDTETTHTECRYPICTLDTTSGSNTYYRNKDKKCIFDAYVEDNIEQPEFTDANLPTTLTDFNTAKHMYLSDKEATGLSLFSKTNIFQQSTVYVSYYASVNKRTFLVS